jgi:hemerythrin-like domain-containing protein
VTRAVEILRADHRCIGALLDAFERVLAASRARAQPLDARAAELLALLRFYADGLHQQREEACLLPRLLARARSVEQRLALGRMCGEHEQERLALRALGQTLLGAIWGSASDLADFQRVAGVFVRDHRRHLLDEERELLPLAERLLEPEDDEAVLAGFAALEGTLAEGTQGVEDRIERLLAAETRH